MVNIYNKSILRFITCGSVDDGKSTLLGRLLYDSGNVYKDHLNSLKKDSKRYGAVEGELDYSLLLDGLQAEREQAITIDVAYRYFDTDKRKFIVADCPGHEQYTRNMVTASSNSELAVLLVDSTKGLLPQTKRHSYLVDLMGIKNIIVAVNKMDLSNYSKEIFDNIKDCYLNFSKKLNFDYIKFIPVSALKGDNIVEKSETISWYDGKTLLGELEDTEIRKSDANNDLIFHVQYVNRPNALFRGYSGTVSVGIIRKNDNVTVLPSYKSAVVQSIITFDGELESAGQGQTVTVVLDSEIDICRGDILSTYDAVKMTDALKADIIWFDEKSAELKKIYIFKFKAKYVTGYIEQVFYVTEAALNLDTKSSNTLSINEVGSCKIKLNEPVGLESYDLEHKLGNFLIVDRLTNNTVGCGLVRGDGYDTKTINIHNVVWHEHRVTKAERIKIKGHKPKIIWFTGLSGSGKSTIANFLEYKLNLMGYHTYLLDGDNVRHGLNHDLGFSDKDRHENIRRIGEVAKLMLDAGIIVIVAFISPFREERDNVRNSVGVDEFVEVYLECPLDVCERRDPKGLYKKARDGQIPEFTGISSPYEEPEHPELIIKTADTSVEHAADMILDVSSLYLK